MKFLDLFKSTDNIQLDKKTLVTLRWIAIAGQFFTINFVYFVLKFSFPYYYCCLVIFLGALTNCYLQFKVKKNLISTLNSAIYLVYDLIQFSTLIFFTGGITNPFIILLVIPAVVSSAFLSLRSVINLSILRDVPNT